MVAVCEPGHLAAPLEDLDPAPDQDVEAVRRVALGDQVGPRLRVGDFEEAGHAGQRAAKRDRCQCFPQSLHGCSPYFLISIFGSAPGRTAFARTPSSRYSTASASTNASTARLEEM